MAGVWADNFGWYQKSQILRYYSSKTEAGTITLGSYGLAGGPGIRLSGALGDDVTITGLTTSGNVAIVQGWFRVSAYPTQSNVLLGIKDGGTFQTRLDLGPTGILRVFRGYPSITVGLLGESTYVVPLNQHVHFALKVTIDNAGSALVHVWEASDTSARVVINVSGDTQNTGSATWDGIHLGDAVTAGDTDWSHIVAMDGSGAHWNDFLPRAEVRHYMPNGAGSSANWAPISGTNFGSVDEVPADDDTSAVDSATVGHRDLYTFEDAPTNRDLGFCVHIPVVKRTGGSGTGHLSPSVKQGVTVTVGSGITVPTSYDALPTIYQVAPDTTPFTPTIWNALEWGYDRTGSAGTIRVTQLVQLLVLLDAGPSGSRNLLTGSTHAVTGSDNLMAGSGNTIAGDISEAHGSSGTVDATLSVLFSQDGSPHTISDDNIFAVYADELRVNGVDIKNAITALTTDVTASGPGSVAATIANDAVTNAKAANMAQATIKGRASGAGTGDPTDLSGTQATVILDDFVGDSGAGGLKGLVPAPAAGDAAADKFLKASGSWDVPTTSGGGSDDFAFFIGVTLG